MLEAALTTTVVLMILFGIIEFGRLVFAYNQVAYLAQDGARYASVRGSTVTSPATTTTIQSYVRGNAVGIGAPAVTTTWQNNSNAPGNWVRVQVASPVQFVAPYMPAPTITVSAVSQLTIAR